MHPRTHTHSLSSAAQFAACLIFIVICLHQSVIWCNFLSLLTQWKVHSLPFVLAHMPEWQAPPTLAFSFFSLCQFCFFLMISLLFLVRFFFYSRRKIREITSKKNRAIKMRRDRRHTRRSELCKIKTSLHSTIRSKTKLFTRAAYTQTHTHTLLTVLHAERVVDHFLCRKKYSQSFYTNFFFLQ